MRTRGSQTFPDFNPATRDAARFGYSPVRDALYNVFKFLGLVAPLTYPRGIDISHWVTDNLKDWGEISKTIVFNYAKSTEGNYYQDVDSQLATLEGKAAGVISLFYAFFRRHINGSSQFNYFKSKTENLILQIGGSKIVICDMETPDGVPNATGNLNFKLFCNAAHTDGYKVGLYVNPAQWVSFGLGAWVNGFVDFYIIAHWQPNNNPDKPSGIDPDKIAIQQEGVLGLHSWIQPIPGLVPQMDANILLWPLAQFETFTGQVWNPEGNPPPPPEPTGDPTLKYITNFAVNIRSGPNTTFPDIGDLPANTIVTALKTLPMDSNSVWVEFEPGKWVAMVHNGGGPFLTFHSSTPCPETDLSEARAGFGLQDVTPPPADFKLREGLPL